MDCDIESFCLALRRNYEETWITSVKLFIDATTFQKDEIGQALTLQDVLNSKKLSARLIFWINLGLRETAHLPLP